MENMAQRAIDAGRRDLGTLILAGEMIVDVLLGGKGNTVLGGWAKLPFFERRENPVVHGGAEAVKHNLLHNGPLLVNRDFDDDVALEGSGVRTKHGIRRH